MNETDELERQIAELRRALDGMAEAAQIKDDEQAAELAELRAAVIGVQDTLDEVRRVLLGNSDAGLVNLVDKLLSTVEGLGRIFERLHHEGQRKDNALAELVEKARGDEAWRRVALTLAALLRLQRDAATI
jgi:hypothetical protein